MLWLGGTEAGEPGSCTGEKGGWRRNINFQRFTKAFRPRTSLSFPSAAPQCTPGALLSLLLLTRSTPHCSFCQHLTPRSKPNLRFRSRRINPPKKDQNKVAGGGGAAHSLRAHSRCTALDFAPSSCAGKRCGASPPR